MKTIGGLRKLRHRGGRLVDWIFTFTAAAYNIVRLRRLLERHRMTGPPTRPSRLRGRHVTDSVIASTKRM